MRRVFGPMVCMCVAAAALAAASTLAPRERDLTLTTASAAVVGGDFGKELLLLGFAEALARPVPDNVALAAPPPGPPPAEAAEAVAPAPPPSPPPPPPPPPRVWTDASYATAVLDAVNAVRRRAGLPPLVAEPRLTLAATEYARHLVATNTFSHTGSDGSTMLSRVQAAGYTEPAGFGEVLALYGGTPQPAAIVQLWMDSPPHRATILSADYAYAGAGCAFGTGGVRCVMDVATP